MRRTALMAGLLALLCSPSALTAAHRTEQIQYGPHQTMSLRAKWPKQNIAYKGIVIQLNPDAPIEQRACVCFDTETLRYSAGWVGGFIDFNGVSYKGQHGVNPGPGGTQLFATVPGPGVAGPDGKFDDHRPNKPYGPLPRQWGHYKGLYHHGQQVVLSYTIGKTQVLELPGYLKSGNVDVFTRTIRLGKSDKPVTLVLCDRVGPKKDAVTPGMINPPAGARKVVDNDRVLLHIPASSTPALFTVGIFCADAQAAAGAIADFTRAKRPDPQTLTKGGPRKWTQTVTTEGRLADPKKDNGAYVVDTITIPFDNPYKSWMRTGGFDFFSDGTSAAVNTWNGDVWIVKGIDDDLDKLEWSRFATGIFDGLGLKIVDDKVYALGRDGITRLTDLNGDGEADYYENFNQDVIVTFGFHEFVFDLQTDSEGNFYFAKGGAVNPGGRGFQIVTPHHGAVLKVSKDGSKLSVIAAGLRAPNGMCVGPLGEITTGENEGTWAPKCRINYWTKQELAKRRGFGGVVDTAQQEPKPKIYDPPICWLPKNVDNSGGGQVWVTSDKWGPFKGDLLHTAYGTSSLYKVLMEKVADPNAPTASVVQGGVVRFPLRFESGVMRSRFNQRDGQLYVMGLKGWQTNAARDGCFQRVRYTGKPVRMPTALHVTKDGVLITFTCKLDRQVAQDTGSYGVEQWNYRWTSTYGSGDFKVSDPKQKGHDTLTVKSAKLSSDGRTVFLAIDGVQPVMQMQIRVNLEEEKGEPVRDTIYNTINKPGPVHKVAGR